MISVIRVIIRIGISVPKGTSKKEIAVVPEMISVPEMIFVPRKVRSLVFCEAMAGKTVPSEMTTATSEMTTAEACTMTTAEASTMTTTEASTMTTASASSTMCKHGGGRERHNARQKQTD